LSLYPLKNYKRFCNFLLQNRPFTAMKQLCHLKKCTHSVSDQDSLSPDPDWSQYFRLNTEAIRIKSGSGFNPDPGI
jgi:hypothetical protein